MSKELEKKDTIRKILGLKSEAVISIPAKRININSLKFDSTHINDERKRDISIEEVIDWIKKAQFSVNVWDGLFERFYCSDGAVYVNLKENTIRTAFRREQFTENLIDSLEVLKK